MCVCIFVYAPLSEQEAIYVCKLFVLVVQEQKMLQQVVALEHELNYDHTEHVCIHEQTKKNIYTCCKASAMKQNIQKEIKTKTECITSHAAL